MLENLDAYGEVISFFCSDDVAAFDPSIRDLGA